MADTSTDNYIGQYQRLSLLGSGGMGNVYLGYDPRLERQVAIKCVRVDKNIQDSTELLKKEAQILAKLNHPHVVQLYDIVEQDTQLALVMEYVKGVSFKDVIKNQDYTLAQALQWLGEISLGLDAAHKKHIIHRDLKPENILLSTDNIPKIADFGIAKLSHTQHTSTAQIIGSYIAFSPEQASGKTLSYKTDIFSLGILAYVLLCNLHPFGKLNEPANIISNILYGGVTSPTKINQEIPLSIEQLILALLEKKQENRPGDLQDIASLFFHHAEKEPLISSDHKYVTQPQETNRSASENTLDVASYVTTVIAKTTLKRDKNTKNIVKNLYKKKKKTLLSTTSIIFMISVVFFFIYFFNINIPPKKNYYIAIIEPTLTSKAITKKEDLLVKSAVFHALEQLIIKADNLYLIPRIETLGAGETLSEIGTRTDADSIISSHIECFDHSCTVTLSRSNDNRWDVSRQEQWDVLKTQLIDTRQLTTQRLTALFNEADISSDPKTEVDRDTYTAYLQLHQDFSHIALKPESSLENITTLIKQSPNYIPLYDLYREVALHAYDDSQNILFLEKLENTLKNAPAHQKSQLNVSWFELRLSQGKYEAAQHIINEISQTNNDGRLIAQINGRLSVAQGDYDTAIEHYLKALSYRKSRDLLYDLALSYWQNGETYSTKSALKKLLDIYPEDYYGLTLQGGIALSEGELGLAQTTYETLLAIEKESSTYANLGLVYFLLGQYEQAYALTQTALKQNPEHLALLLNAADIIKAQGNIPLANSYYQNIVTRLQEPKTFEHMLILPQAHAQLGNYEQAITALQQLLKHSPNDPNGAFTAALVYTLAGEHTSAIINIRQALDYGMSAVWFKPLWFKPLCKKDRFVELINNTPAYSVCEKKG